MGPYLGEKGEGVDVEDGVASGVGDDTTTSSVKDRAALDGVDDGVHERVADDGSGVDLEGDAREAANTELEGRGIARRSRTGRGDGPKPAGVDARVASRLLEKKDVNREKDVSVNEALEGAVPVRTLGGQEAMRRLDLGAGQTRREDARRHALGEVAEERVVELVADEARLERERVRRTANVRGKADAEGRVGRARVGDGGHGERLEVAEKKADVVAVTRGMGVGVGRATGGGVARRVRATSVRLAVVRRRLVVVVWR